MAPLPSLASAEWRLDVELASRALMHRAEPTFVLKLKTTQAGEEDEGTVVLEADAAHMKHLELQLAAAVAELDTVRTTRILKYVK